MAVNKSVISAAGRDREIGLQAPGAAIAAADTNRWEIQQVPEEVQGVIVAVNITAVTTSSVTVNIYGVDAYANTRLLLSSAALTTVQTKILKVHPFLTASANSVAQDIIGSRIMVEAVNGNANSTTYSISAELIY